MVVRRLSNDELYHHGILGQKWGVRRYQNKDGSLTSAGRKRKGLLTTIKDKKKMKKLRAAKEAKKKERQEREEVINSGDYNQVKKIQNKLTDEEYVRALTRISYNEKLKEYQSSRQKDKLEKGMKWLQTTASVAKTVSEISGSAANVRKALEDLGVVEKKQSSLEKLKSVNATTTELINQKKLQKELSDFGVKKNSEELNDMINSRKLEILKKNRDKEAVESILGIKRGKDDDDKKK